MALIHAVLAQYLAQKLLHPTTKIRMMKIVKVLKYAVVWLPVGGGKEGASCCT